MNKNKIGLNILFIVLALIIGLFIFSIKVRINEKNIVINEDTVSQYRVGVYGDIDTKDDNVENIFNKIVNESEFVILGRPTGKFSVEKYFVKYEIEVIKGNIEKKKVWIFMDVSYFASSETILGKELPLHKNNEYILFLKKYDFPKFYNQNKIEQNLYVLTVENDLSKILYIDNVNIISLKEEEYLNYTETKDVDIILSDVDDFDFNIYKNLVLDYYSEEVNK